MVNFSVFGHEYLLCNVPPSCRMMFLGEKPRNVHVFYCGQTVGQKYSESLNHEFTFHIKVVSLCSSVVAIMLTINSDLIQ